MQTVGGCALLLLWTRGSQLSRWRCPPCPLVCCAPPANALPPTHPCPALNSPTCHQRADSGESCSGRPAHTGRPPAPLGDRGASAAVAVHNCGALCAIATDIAGGCASHAELALPSLRLATGRRVAPRGWYARECECDNTLRERGKGSSASPAFRSTAYLDNSESAALAPTASTSSSCVSITGCIHGSSTPPSPSCARSAQRIVRSSPRATLGARRPCAL
mmetsp:Transcript_17192/g.40852  ORF Transcript_17192/g.40852 Transcript_17192/m.40852 type:complete len:220 (-) Transcript_17192:200-859(-)